MCKLLDVIIINKYGDLLGTCEMQCGFKEKGFTNMCYFMVKETIQYYLHNSSNVHAAVLDATKAFDRINFCKLFKKLMARNIPPLITRLLVEMYTNQNMDVKWNRHYSTSFSISNGVRQGGWCLVTDFILYIHG